MGDPTGISGAVLGALVTEVVKKAKLARCYQENCNSLAETVDFASPIIDKLAQSFSSSRSIDIEKWLSDMKKILKEAEEEVSRCSSSSSKTRFNIWKRGKLSENLMLIEAKINKKIQQSQLLNCGSSQLLEEIHHVVVKDVAVEEFVPQLTPKEIVAFKGDPFQQLLGHVLSQGDALGDPMTIGLKGQGGVGKTLLAKMVHNDSSVQEKFGCDCMLYITIGRDASISSVYKVMADKLQVGKLFEEKYALKKKEDQHSFLSAKFLEKRVLLILDDIWIKGGITWWLDIAKGPGSVTLVTTRDDNVLSNINANVTLDVQTLSQVEGWKLFSYHAFGSNMPSCEIEKVARNVCAECDGLPLALEVIGSALRGKKDVRIWQSARSRLKISQQMSDGILVEERLFNRLRYSYEEMEEFAQKCFIYVAAYPEDFDIPMDELCSIWLADDIFEFSCVEEGMDFAYSIMRSLVNRSMIKLDEIRETINVHDILRDLAIHIISTAKAEEWAFGCYFHAGKTLEKLPPIERPIKRMSLHGSQILELPIKFQVPELRICLLSRIKVCKNLEGSKIPNCFFDSMKKLQLLNIGEHSIFSTFIPKKFNGRILPSFEEFEFAIMGRCMRELPRSISELKSLTSLDLSHCQSLEELPEGIKELKSLTSLNLRWCSSLEELPEGIKELKSLTSLDLSWCESLKTLPEGIKELKSLTSLDLSQCRSLKELPEGIKELKSLTSLDLSYCESLKTLPEGIKELKSLTSLNLRWCSSLEELPEGIKELKSLTSLDLSYCESLKTLPEGIKELKSLTSLNLRWCSSLEELPEGIKELKSLTSLDLSYCKSLKTLPEGIKELKSLTNLDLSYCESLETLHEGIKELKSLTSLDLSYCESLKTLPEGIKELKSLTSLNLSHCRSLKELPEGIKELKSLTSLDLSCCESLETLPEGIKELKPLTSLDLSYCESLKTLPEGIKELKSLTSLNLSHCRSLKELPEGIKELKSLTSLDLSYCKSLKTLSEGIKELKSLTSLNLTWCSSLEELLEGIKELKSLTSLDLSWCKSLKTLHEGIKELKSLTSLDLSWCESLETLPEGIKELKSLISLNLSHCRSLKELPEGIKELKSLTSLNLRWCSSLEELPEGIKELKSLTSLDLFYCKSLKTLPEGIKELKSLTNLDLSYCESLKTLPEGIIELKPLTSLDLSYCESLKTLPEGIKELKSLTSLNLTWCSLLEDSS